MDYTLDGGTVSEVMRYLAGFGVHAQETVMGGTGGGTGVSPVNGAVRFLHGDLTRSTMMTTTPGGSGGGGTGSGGTGSGGIGGGTGVPPVVAYTAFGDPVVWDEGTETWRVGWPAGAGGVGVPPVTRYQYKGGWGYESGLITLWGENPDLPPVTLQHVGWRWYQPSLGRFVQRDPIGLEGGCNVYEYVRSNPTLRVDPQGLYWDWDDIVHRDGSITRHFYDRGWTGWFKNEYQYSVTIPPGKTPPAPPRTFDQRCVTVAKGTTLGVISGAVGGGIRGAATGTPEGILIGVAAGGLFGGVTGFVSGVIVEWY